MREIDRYDSEFFDARIGKAIGCDEDLLAWGESEKLDLLCLLIGADDPTLIQLAEQEGFRYMDTRVTLTRTTAKLDGLRSVRPAFPLDRAWLRPIARYSHRITRFYADPHLYNCDDYYDRWLCNALDDPDVTVLVALSKEAYPVGYATLSSEGDRASIDLIAVAQNARGQGHGNALVTEAIDWAAKNWCSEISVVTQGRNIDAQRLFQHAGFRTIRTELWFHRWRP